MATPARQKPSDRKSKLASRTSSDAILAAVPDMMFRMDREGRYLYFKPAKGQEPYVPADQLIGRSITDVLPKEVANPALTLIAEALDSRETKYLEYPLFEKDGVRQYESRIVPMGKNDVLVIVRDISPREQSNGRATAGLDYALTDRELAVLQAVAGGHTDKQIGKHLTISPMTVRKHVASIRRKMGAQSRTEASVRALKEGLLS